MLRMAMQDRRPAIRETLCPTGDLELRRGHEALRPTLRLRARRQLPEHEG
jgi:hypothetical protein